MTYVKISRSTNKVIFDREKGKITANLFVFFFANIYKNSTIRGYIFKIAVYLFTIFCERALRLILFFTTYNSSVNQKSINVRLDSQIELSSGIAIFFIYSTKLTL